MKIFILLIGMPASGKTTMRASLFKEASVICPDDLIDYEGSGWTPRQARNAWKKSDKDLKNLLTEGEPLVILDSTMVARKKRTKYIKLAKSKDYKCIALYCNTNYFICKKRNNDRPDWRRVPNHTIDSMAKRLEEPVMKEGFDKVITYNFIFGEILELKND